MGFGDKLKGLRDQAQQAVADNKDKIQGAVQTVGEAANAKTHGKYATKIAKVGEKVSGSVERMGGDQAGASAAAGGAAGDQAGAAAPGGDSVAPQASGFDQAAAPAAEAPAPPATPPASDDAPAPAPPDFE